MRGFIVLSIIFGASLVASGCGTPGGISAPGPVAGGWYSPAFGGVTYTNAPVR